MGGELQFDARYDGNILVNAFTCGVARTNAIFYGRASGIGNKILYIGAKTGRDGIHGATMASDEFSSGGGGGAGKRPQVRQHRRQVGDLHGHSRFSRLRPQFSSRPTSSRGSRTWGPPGSRRRASRWPDAPATACVSTSTGSLGAARRRCRPHEILLRASRRRRSARSSPRALGHEECVLAICALGSRRGGAIGAGDRHPALGRFGDTGLRPTVRPREQARAGRRVRPARRGAHRRRARLRASPRRCSGPPRADRPVDHPGPRGHGPRARAARPRRLAQRRVAGVVLEAVRPDRPRRQRRSPGLRRRRRDGPLGRRRTHGREDARLRVRLQRPHVRARRFHRRRDGGGGGVPQPRVLGRRGADRDDRPPGTSATWSAPR